MASRAPDLEIVGGVAAMLAAESVLAWDDFGDGTAYDGDTEWPTFLGPLMPASPNRLAVITPTTQLQIRATLLQNFQLRIRGSAITDETEPTLQEVSDQRQAILDVLYPNGFPIVHVQLGTVRAGIIRYLGSTPTDPDSSGRLGMMMNFQARARRPRPV
jgi:hypothetical protein